MFPVNRAYPKTEATKVSISVLLKKSALAYWKSSDINLSFSMLMGLSGASLAQSSRSRDRAFPSIRPGNILVSGM